MRAFVLTLLFVSSASAQVGVPPPPPISLPGMNVTQEAAEQAVEAALAQTLVAVVDSASVEVLEAIRASFGATAPQDQPEADDATERQSAPARRRGAQTYPTLYQGYGYEGDGFPERTTVAGTVTAAGSLRLCREGRPPVSRWLQVRLEGMPEGVPPVHVVVAVQCDEWAAQRYLGRHVRIDALKSSPEQEIRMARRDLPASDSPLYLTDPTRVEVAE